jgi:hypothetical protein
VDRKTWTFDIAEGEPVVEQGMMVQGRNAKKLCPPALTHGEASELVGS